MFLGALLAVHSLVHGGGARDGRWSECLKLLHELFCVLIGGSQDHALSYAFTRWILHYRDGSNDCLGGWGLINYFYNCSGLYKTDKRTG